VTDHRHDILEAAFPGQSARFFLAMRIGDTPASGDAGAELILRGIKTATSSPFSDYPDGRIPFAGALSVLLDGRDRPVGIVETTGVDIVRFRDVTAAMAQAYGEGERTLGWWRREIGGWYRDKAVREARTFSDDDEIIWEWIAVLRRLQPGSGTP
jgi:uncharacterized protein YhfF